MPSTITPKPKYPIFVPTKGRADVATLPYVLQKERLEHTLVVEPQEAVAYREAFPFSEMMVLPKGGQGLTYSKQHILDHVRALGVSFHWQIDDNIKGFLRVKNHRCVPTSAGAALGGIEDIVSKYPRVFMAAPEYKQFAWAAEKAYKFNRHCWACHLLNTCTGIDFDLRFMMKQDKDFLLQHLVIGKWISILVSRWAMDKPTMGKNSRGGCVSLYREGQNARYARLLCKKWPKYCSLMMKSAGLDACIDWAAIDELFPFSRKEGRR